MLIKFYEIEEVDRTSENYMKFHLTNKLIQLRKLNKLKRW